MKAKRCRILDSFDYKIFKGNIWAEKFPEIKVNISSGNIYKHFFDSKIVISTYNATSFLETLSLNIPTIVFWDEKYFQLNDEAIVYFELLKEAKIFHADIKSASDHLIKIWDNVENWWFDDEVQKIREIFCSNFANINGLNIRKFYKFLSYSADNL